MTRLERVIQAFNDYDNLVEDLRDRVADYSGSRCDVFLDIKLKDLRDEVSVLIGELKRHGCRRKD